MATPPMAAALEQPRLAPFFNAYIKRRVSRVDLSNLLRRAGRLLETRLAFR